MLWLYFQALAYMSCTAQPKGVIWVECAVHAVATGVLYQGGSAATVTCITATKTLKHSKQHRDSRGHS